MKLEAWTIKQLHEAMLNDLQQCHTQLERSMCATIGKKEIREFASKLERKLTPMEQVILESI